MAALSPARKIAFDILAAVARSNPHSDTLLHSHRVDKLSESDRNLATTLVLGALRWQLHLDALINPLLAKPNARLDVEVRLALRLGAFQLLHLDRIPAHAAIDESVELTKHAGHTFAARMVNAVLRKLAASAESLRMQSGEQLAEAAVAAHPAWLVERWTAHFGADTTRAICLHGQTQPETIARLIDPAAESELLAFGILMAPSALLTAARRVVSIPSQFEFTDGKIRIQDEGSQLIGEIASFPVPNLIQDQQTILDVCAAPGGKSLILAERNPDAHIAACEFSEQRLAALCTRLAHLGPRIQCLHADATALTFENEFNVVLADVPCSGTGTLGRNPEIRHRFAPVDLPHHAARQQAILAAAIRAAKPGGQIIYSTCSLEPEENEQVVSAVLDASPNVRVAPIAVRLDAMLAHGILTPTGAEALHTCLTPEGFLCLLPGVAHTDGFFIALLEKLH